MPNHSPAPWAVLGSRVQLNDVCFVASTNSDYPLSLSNARLIAAAPELLSALEIAADWLCARVGSEEEAIAAVTAAIAKAKGE